jgi:imidazolonepropionase-like amidohydrolase
MHMHAAASDGLLDIASGVTGGRDLGNDVGDLKRLTTQWDSGTAIGPQVWKAGLIDGRGPYQSPTGAYVDTPAEAVAAVNRYADLGYVQIKLYSSLKPELVAPIADEAHRRGLRVSGHIPAGLVASEAVKLGYDEIQHVNFLVLNFMPDVKETRTPARFTEPGKRAADLDLGSAEVRAFIELLRDRHTALDPTLSIFERTYLDRPGEVPIGMRAVADRLPVQVRRFLTSGALALPPGNEERYRASWKKMLALVHQMYAAGIPIEAGTDNMAGFALHRELELDVEAGIPAPEVLRLATLGAARIMGFERDLGSVRPGKLADVVLIDGDPARRIADVRRAVLTVKDGVVYRAAELFGEAGVRP